MGEEQTNGPAPRGDGRGTGGAARGWDRALLRNVSDMVTVSDPEGRIVYANPATERVTGYAPEEFATLSPFELMHPEDRPRCEEAFGRLAATPGLVLELEHRFRRKDGEWCWAEGTFASRFDDPEVGGLVATVRDVTDRKRVEEELRESEERHRLIVEGALDYAIFTLDPEGTIASWSPGAEAVFGWGAEEAVGRPFAITFTPEDREAGVPGEELATARKDGSALNVRWHLRKDGSRVFIEGHTRALRHGDGERSPGFLKIGQDVTGRRAMEEELAHRAFHDPLTDLPNRALFEDRLEHALARKERRAGERVVAVLYLDLDDFKRVNDSLGHGAGDELLVEAAKRLRGSVRPQDTVARLGGDEFAVVLEDVRGEAGATKAAGRIAGELSAPFAVRGREVFVTPSVGIALAAGGGEKGPDALLGEADTAMYGAKGSGKDRHAVFRPGMGGRLVGALADRGPAALATEGASPT